MCKTLLWMTDRNSNLTDLIVEDFLSFLSGSDAATSGLPSPRTQSMVATYATSGETLTTLDKNIYNFRLVLRKVFVNVTLFKATAQQLSGEMQLGK